MKWIFYYFETIATFLKQNGELFGKLKKHKILDYDLKLAINLTNIANFVVVSLI